MATWRHIGMVIARSSVCNIVHEPADKPPAAPAGRKRKLSPSQEAEVVKLFEHWPSATDDWVAHRMTKRHKKFKKHPVTAKDICRTRERAKPPVVLIKPGRLAKDIFTPQWKDEHKAFLSSVKKIPWSRRFYYDQSVLPLSPKDLPSVKARKSSKPSKVSPPKTKKNHTLHAVLGVNGVAMWELSSKHYTDKTIGKFVVNKVMPVLKADDVLFFDRLGSTRTMKEPKTQHFNPIMLAVLKEHGVNTMHLPFKGAGFDPIELLFGDFKRHYLWPKQMKQKEGVISARTLRSVVRDYMNGLTPTRCRGFFEARADGQQLQREGLLK